MKSKLEEKDAKVSQLEEKIMDLTSSLEAKKYLMKDLQEEIKCSRNSSLNLLCIYPLPVNI